jgi:hypothetical protein
MGLMQVTKGTVVDGKIVVEGEPLPEGFTVTVLAAEDVETFELGSAEESEILEAIEEAKRGAVVRGGELLRRMGRRT